MESKRYNGWTNYETWCVKLWLDNEQGSYNWLMDQARELWEEAEPTKSWTRIESATFALADRLKDQHEETMADLGMANGVFFDLLRAAVSEVNWNEIAKAVIEDCEFAETVEA